MVQISEGISRKGQEIDLVWLKDGADLPTEQAEQAELESLPLELNFSGDD